MIFSASVIVPTFSSFLTPDRLEKLNTIGFVWSVRGESSSAEKNTTDVLPDNKVESTTISVVDAVMAKGEVEDTADAVQEEEVEAVGEEAAAVKSEQDKDDEGNAAAEAAAAAAVDEDIKDAVAINV